MDLVMLVKLGALLSIFLVVVSIGLRTRLADALTLIRHPPLGGRAFLAMFVAVPAMVIGITYVLPVSAAIKAALIALSVSPMPPILPMKEEKAGGRADYIIGLQVLGSLISIVMAPLVITLAGRVFGVETRFNLFALSKILLLTVGAPLALGAVIHHLWPAFAVRIAEGVRRAGLVLLLVASGAIMLSNIPAMLATLGNGALAAMVVICCGALLIGHLLGGPHRGNRGALAVACATRHPGVAIAIATATFPMQQKALTGAVMLYVIVSVLIAIPYVNRQRRLIAAAAPD